MHAASTPCQVGPPQPTYLQQLGRRSNSASAQRPNAAIVNNPANSLLTVNAGGYSISIPYSLIRRAGVDPRTIGSANLTDSGSDDTSSDIWPSASDTSAIDQSNALQDTLNQQQALNNEQENIDKQNFENTENMINSQNEANAAMQMGNP